MYKYREFKEYISSHIYADIYKTGIAYNCIEGNNCDRVNRIFITSHAIRESSTDQYERKERRTNQAGIFIDSITNTKVFIRALGNVVTSIFVNLIEVPGKMANGPCAESAVTCTNSVSNVIDTEAAYIGTYIGTCIYVYYSVSFFSSILSSSIST